MFTLREMRKFTRSFILLHITAILLLSHIGADPIADSDWYELELVEITSSGANFYDGSIDINNFNSQFVNFARLLTSLEQTTSVGYENLLIRFNAPDGQFRFVSTENPSSSLNVWLRMQHEDLPVQTIVPQEDYLITAGNVGDLPTETNLYIDITSRPPNQGEPLRGTYYFPLEIQIFDKDGYRLRDKTLHLSIIFRRPSTTPTPITVVTVIPKPTADYVPVPYPFQPGTAAITVGEVHFQSNEEYGKYRLKISPVGQTSFQFNHLNPNIGGAIKYKVTIPSRTIVAYEQEFTFNLDYKGTYGAWYDTLDIGVRDVNYNNFKGSPGDYVSSIKIELISY